VADIPIQRREGRNIWPMVIGLLVLAAALWFIFARNTGTDTAAARADSAAVVNSGVTTDSAAGAAATTPAGARTDSAAPRAP
jgi:hypothetical protein